ncbi:hypothetical protein EVAR_77206_1 [Eumeta japonica]|uniref:Uncharacterized protein n=1 Tax=Eumeta variegata TaxID=151549 RepID=A0A4C1T5I7_EUMVA|nr:hypothetical protein EVAR_77206_1 [Eumeta japonica]
MNVSDRDVTFEHESGSEKKEGLAREPASKYGARTISPPAINFFLSFQKKNRPYLSLEKSESISRTGALIDRVRRWGAGVGADDTRQRARAIASQYGVHLLIDTVRIREVAELKEKALLRVNP